jgi:hypothetical protein
MIVIPGALAFSNCLLDAADPTLHLPLLIVWVPN